MVVVDASPTVTCVSTLAYSGPMKACQVLFHACLGCATWSGSSGGAARSSSWDKLYSSARVVARFTYNLHLNLVFSADTVSPRLGAPLESALPRPNPQSCAPTSTRDERPARSCRADSSRCASRLCWSRPTRNTRGYAPRFAYRRCTSNPICRSETAVDHVRRSRAARIKPIEERARNSFLIARVSIVPPLRPAWLSSRPIYHLTRRESNP